MKWKEVEYSRSQIITAGKTVRALGETSVGVEAFLEAHAVIDNWRAAHAFPMHVFYMHLRNMTSLDPNIVVAERLKRMESIISKLIREPSMNLWTMQDLGGCRVIVPQLEQVYEYADKYRNSRIRHRYKNENDYIWSPKKSGYRSYHLIYQYHSDKKETYNRNMQIEIQFRTQLQHSWATAVETMGLFTKQALKSGEGEDDTKRFFALISSMFALEEGTAIIPNTSNSSEQLIAELRILDKRHHYLDILKAMTVVVNKMDEKAKKSHGHYILILNYETRTLHARFYENKHFQEAIADYNQLETKSASNEIDTVLVSASSFSALKIAYPNYFSDIRDFILKVSEYIEENEK